MAKTISARERRCRTFLRALAAGRTVSDACASSGLGWGTLYRWRRVDPEFRRVWDEAAQAGEDALAARFDDALVRRAVDGIDEKVFHAGEEVGTRRRYSDPLLMFGIRDLRARRRAASGPIIARTPRVTVVIRQLEEPKHVLAETPPLLSSVETKETGDE